MITLSFLGFILFSTKEEHYTKSNAEHIVLLIFPKKHVFIYTNYRVFKSRLFKDLILQSSPKILFFIESIKTRIGYLISTKVFKVLINDNFWNYKR